MKYEVYCIYVFAALVLVSVCGCHSSRATTERAETERTTILYAGSRKDSVETLHTAACAKEYSLEVSSEAIADIRIVRDSAGRINRIVYRGNNRYVQSGRTQQWQHIQTIQNSGSYSASASDSVVAVSKKEAEVTKKVGSRISLTEMVGVSLMLIVFLYLVYILITDGFPWIRKHKR